MKGRLIVAAVLALALLGASAWFFGFRSPPGPGVAVDNPCEHFPSLDGALATWMLEQRRRHPALTCEHFDRVGEETATVRLSSPWTDDAGAVGRAPLRWRSPSGTRMLLLEAGAIALVDLAEGSRRVLLESTTGETWTDAAWIDEQSFVAAGIGQSAPTLTVFRLDANRATVFRGPSPPRP